MVRSDDTWASRLCVRLRFSDASNISWIFQMLMVTNMHQIPDEKQEVLYDDESNLTIRRWKKMQRRKLQARQTDPCLPDRILNETS